MEREKERLQSKVTSLKSETTNVLKEELEQERLACRQMKNEIDQIQMNECGVIVSHNEKSHIFPSSFLLSSLDILHILPIAHSKL